MASRNSLPLLSALLAVAALFAAAGCTPDAARWSTTEAPKENKAEFVRLTHQVRFAPGSTVPAAGEDRRLESFLSQVELGYGDQVTLDTGPQQESAATDRLAARRVDAVAALLRRLQVNAKPAVRPTVEGALAHDAVIVTVGRYVITPPVCPDWSKPEADDYTNTPPSNFGCATVGNLGAMIANPADLVHGTPMTGGDADFASRGVQRYRSGEISKSLNPELPKQYSGGSGGSGQ